MNQLESIHQQITNCNRCEGVRSYCARIAAEKKAAHRNDTYWGKPVPGFGDPDARVVIPIKSGLRSLNVAVAAGMALGGALRQTSSPPEETAP